VIQTVREKFSCRECETIAPPPRRGACPRRLSPRAAGQRLALSRRRYCGRRPRRIKRDATAWCESPSSRTVGSHGSRLPDRLNRRRKRLARRRLS
jgi:hypothetical protein